MKLEYLEEAHEFEAQKKASREKRQALIASGMESVILSV